MYKYKFRIPPYYTLLVRSLTILEGIALASDKNYKVLGAAYPWVARRLLTDTSPELRATLRKLLYDESGMFRFDRMESLMEQAVRTPPPPRKARVRAAPRGQDHIRGALEGSADDSAKRAAASAGALSLLLSEEGTYLRGIMLDELAKGVDAAARVQLDAGAQSVRSALAAVAAGESAGVSAGAAGLLSSLAAPVATAVTQLSQRVSAIPEASDATDRQQVWLLPACVMRRGRGHGARPSCDTTLTHAKPAAADTRHAAVWRIQSGVCHRWCGTEIECRLPRPPGGMSAHPHAGADRRHPAACGAAAGARGAAGRAGARRQRR